MLACPAQAVSSNDNSHLVVVPPGPVLSDVLIGSAVFQGEGGAFGMGGGGEGGGEQRSPGRVASAVVGGGATAAAAAAA
jgi:hypothetical protein